MSDLIKKLEGKDFKETVAKGMTLVDCYAEWCAPCRMLTPVLEELAHDMSGKVHFCKLDIDKAREVASELQVTSVPTLVLFKDGREVNRTVGLKDAESLKEFIEEGM